MPSVGGIAGQSSVRAAAVRHNRAVPHKRPARAKERATMLMTIAVILIVLWALGFVTSYTMGGLIHVLLVIAIIVILVRVIQGRKVL
jgi:hypothetical protein